MHTFQLAAEDYGVQNDGAYADTITCNYENRGGPGGADRRNHQLRRLGVAVGSRLALGKSGPLILILTAGQ